MTFDCLFFKGEDIRKEPKLELRLQKIQICTKEIFGQVSDNVQYSGDFDLKKIIHFKKLIFQFSIIHFLFFQQ